METHLRLILFLVGMVILTLVIIDLYKQYKLKLQAKLIFGSEADELAINSKSKQQAFDFEINEATEDYLSTTKVVNPNISKVELTTAKVMQPQVIADSDSNKVLAFLLMAKNRSGFAGDKLITILETANLSYGKFNIFHRLAKDNQQQILFSVASAVEPGSFNLAQLDKQFIPGLTIFMLPNKVKEPKKVFELLLQTAQQLASSLNVELKEQNHELLTLASINKYRNSLAIDYSN